MLKIKGTATVHPKAQDFYAPKFKPGMKVSVDAIKPYMDCESGFMVRVIGIWMRPRWFDAHWFSELKRERHALRRCGRFG